MVAYYVIVNKKDIHKTSGLLPSEKFGLSTVGEFPYRTDTHHSVLSLYNELKGANLYLDPKTQTIRKLEGDDISLGNKKEAGKILVSENAVSGDSVRMIGGYVDSDIKLRIVSQILPNGKERTKDDARQEEIKSVLYKKESPVIRAATSIAQKVIDIKERNVGKEMKNDKSSKENIQKPHLNRK